MSGRIGAVRREGDVEGNDVRLACNHLEGDETGVSLLLGPGRVVAQNRHAQCVPKVFDNLTYVAHADYTQRFASQSLPALQGNRNQGSQNVESD